MALDQTHDAELSGVVAAGAQTVLHLDPATVVNGTVTATTQDARIDWPIPVGALSQADRDKYGM